MQRALVVLLVVLASAVSAGCMGDDSSDNSAANTTTTDKTPVTITFWSPFTDRALRAGGPRLPRSSA